MNARLRKLFSSFHRAEIDALFISSSPNVTYLSGFKGVDSWIFISPAGLYFITDSRYSEQAADEAKGFKIILRNGQSVSEIVAGLARRHKIKALGFESQIVTHSFYMGIVKQIGIRRLRAMPGLVESLREIKD